MKLKGIHSTALCTSPYDPTGQNPLLPQQTPSYVLVPSTPEPIANCGYGPQNAYYLPSTPTTGEPETTTPTTPTAPGQPEEVGTCTVTMVKHCDNPEPPAPVTTTQTVQAPQPSPPTLIFVTPSVAEPPKTTIIVPPPKAPMPPQQLVPVAPVHPPVVPMVPMAPSSGMPTQMPIMGSGMPSQMPIMGSGMPSQMPIMGSGMPTQMPAGVPMVPMVPAQSTQMPMTPVIPQQSSGMCSCAAPQISAPNPMPPSPINMTGNGYPVSSSGYNPTVGTISSCSDAQKLASTGQCEQKPQTTSPAQYGAEACSNPTPTVVINGSEYLVAPPMYSAMNSCSNPCPCASQAQA